MNLKKDHRTANDGKNIFISYRVHDTAGETGRLADRLKQHFATEKIFMDLDKIDPGADFTKVLSGSLEQCDLLLMIIGPNWVGRDRDTGTLRIMQDGDWVRKEISTALQRGITIVPVLVDGGQLPAAEELPEDLQPILHRQAYEVSNRRWDYDTDQLIQFLVRSGCKPVNTGHKGAGAERSWFSKNSRWIYFAAAALIIAVIILWNNSGSDESSEPYNISGTWVEHGDHDPFTIKIATLPNDSLTGTATYISEDGGEFSYAVSGSLFEDDVHLQLKDLGVLNGKLTIDGNNINGTLTYVTEHPGLPQSITLIYQHDANEQ